MTLSSLGHRASTFAPQLARLVGKVDPQVAATASIGAVAGATCVALLCLLRSRTSRSRTAKFSRLDSRAAGALDDFEESLSDEGDDADEEYDGESGAAVRPGRFDMEMDDDDGTHDSNNTPKARTCAAPSLSVSHAADWD